MHLVSLWIGESIDSKSYNIVNQNLKKFRNFEFISISREDILKNIPNLSKDLPTITISDICRVSYLKPENVYLDCDFVVIDSNFSSFLRKNDVLPESPFVLANGFLHLTNQQIRSEYTQFLLENLEISHREPHFVTGPYAFTRYICQKVWNDEETFHVISSKDVLVLPGFVNSKTIKLLNIKYAYTHSLNSSWIQDELVPFKLGVIRSLLWYIVNQARISSAIIFFMRGIFNLRNFRLIELKNRYRFNFTTRIICSILDICTKGEFFEYSDNQLLDSTKILNDGKSESLWNLIEKGGLFGCVISQDRRVANQVLSQGISEICVLNGNALLSWSDGKSEYVWSSFIVPFSNLRVCFRRNFHNMKFLGTEKEFS